MSQRKTQNTLTLGLLTIPVKVRKATDSNSNSILKDVAVHEDGSVEKIDRSERCASGKPIVRKAKAFEVSEGVFRVIEDGEMASIEEITRTHEMIVCDVQPLKYLPLTFSTAAYYLSHNKDTKTQPRAFAYLTKALMKSRLGLVVKVGSSAKQHLGVIHAEAGILILRYIPFRTELRFAGDDEKLHWSLLQEIKDDDPHLLKLYEVLNVNRQRVFQYQEFVDDGVVARTECVERIMAGEILPEAGESAEIEVTAADFSAALDATLQALTA